MDTSASSDAGNGADLDVLDTVENCALGPVLLHTSGRRFDAVRAHQPDTGTRMPVGATIGILVVGLILAGIGFPRRRKRKMSLVCWRRALSSSLLVPFPFLGVLFSSFAGREW